MSRVFEALAKAGEEKHGQVQRPVEEIESPVLTPRAGEGEKPTPEPHFVATGTVSGMNGNSP